MGCCHPGAATNVSGTCCYGPVMNLDGEGGELNNNQEKKKREYTSGKMKKRRKRRGKRIEKIGGLGK